MEEGLVKIKLHGVLGKGLSKKTWNLNVSSVNEAIHAINCLSSSKLYRNINNLSSKGVKYVIRINKEIQKKEKSTNILNLKRDDLKTVDVVPVIEGAFFGSLGNWGTALLGGALMFAGGDLAIIGAVMMFAGASNALSKPPELPEMRSITNPSSDPQALSQSYLFGGPVNIINEGGPVPIGYGRLIVGSQVILSSYEVSQKLVENAGRVI